MGEEIDRYASPAGFYGIIAEQKKGVVIRHRYGVVSRFDAPERGGRPRLVEDRNRNRITLGSVVLVDEAAEAVASVDRSGE